MQKMYKLDACITVSSAQHRQQCPESLRHAAGGSSSQRKPAYTGNGTFWLLAINLAIFLADHVLHVPQVPAFYLYHMSPRWWQVNL